MVGLNTASKCFYVAEYSQGNLHGCCCCCCCRGVVVGVVVGVGVGVGVV